MLKVIIADDEIRVCKLIHHLVDWESMGLEVVAIIHDGISALEAIKDNKPDIVITDIRMPGYDGIELIGRTKKIFPEIYFIIISGHSQFDYAQSAIKYGVENYLLKPIKKVELVNTLARVIEKHRSIQLDNTERKELKTLLRSSGEKAKKNFLSEILSNSTLLSDNYDINLINQEYYSHFQSGFFTIAVIYPFLDPEEENDEMMSLLLTKIQSMVKEQLESKCIELITVIWEEQIVCLINTDDQKLTSIKKQFLRMKIDIANLKHIFQKVRVIIGFGEINESLEDIYSNIEKAQIAVQNRFSQSGSYILEYKDTEESKVKVTDIIDSTLKDRLLSCFETLSIDKILHELDELKIIFEENSQYGRLLYNCYNELIDIILFGVRKHPYSNNLPDTTWFRKQYNCFYTLEQIFEWLKNWINNELNKYKELKRNRDNKPIRIAKQYIYDNYNKSISLEEISSLIGFNPAYFSTMFKKETGENFIDYVVKIRIQNAKNHLLQSDMTIDDVANSVGYSDTKYFSRLFKKKTGLNPSQFRKLYG